jgi:cellulase/cellobiase CelA1
MRFGAAALVTCAVAELVAIKEDEIGYGEAISGLTNGSHYVVGTSRNGAGPAPDSELDWCNPSGRALGTPPTASTAGAHADAYLWIKRPGESDGSFGKCDRAGGHLCESVRHRPCPQGGLVSAGGANSGSGVAINSDIIRCDWEA